MKALTQAAKKSSTIRTKALELVRYVREKDWRGQVFALFEFVRDHIRYVRDIRGVETIATPEQVLRQQQGDCDDKAVLLASLLESIGHPTLFMAVGFEPGKFSHVLTQTLIGRRWVYLDPTERVGLDWRPDGIVLRSIVHN